MAGPFSLGPASSLLTQRLQSMAAQQNLSSLAKSVPYYPHQRYVDKNLAPESFPIDSLKALAKAQVAATKGGHLRPEVADLMLANAMIEGRPDDYGVSSDANSKTPAYKALVAPQEAAREKYLNAYNFGSSADKAITDSDIYALEQEALKKQSKYSWREHNAAKAATILSDKQILADKIRPGGDPMEVIKLWNGTGPDSERHASRVKVAQELLDHPSNAAIKTLYNKFLAEGASQ